VSDKARLFLILWLPGLVGVLSFLLVDLSALIAALPMPEGSPPVELPPPAVLKLVSIIQPTVLMTLAVALGVWLAPKVGLHAPAFEALARSGSRGFFEKLKPQILPAVIAGLAGGVGIVAAWVTAKPFLTSEFISQAERFNTILPAAVRFLYGGVAEELLLRWGLMTLLVWAGSRIAGRVLGRKDDDRGIRHVPSPVVFIAAIIISAVVFGLGHLPIASLLNGGLTLLLVIYVVTANSLFGIIAGFLYWLRGLEAAMIAHMFAHVVLLAAISFSF
jgi:membrane protease YdiL (CAAX protease family)